MTAPAGDWLVVPAPAGMRGWRWGRIVEQLADPGPARFRVRWVGHDRDSVVVPPEGYRIEPARRWPDPPATALGLWPHHEPPPGPDREPGGRPGTGTPPGP